MPDILARLKVRTGTIAAWTSANPVLASGEIGFESDTNVMRIGDGSTSYLSLEKFETSTNFASLFQAKNINLDGLSGLNFAANKLPYATGIGTMALTELTAEARIFLTQATKALQRASLGLGTSAIVNTNSSDVMTSNPTLIPTREAVAGAILKVGGPAKRIVYTASTTFIKADHGAFPDDHLVMVEVWGGGQGGGRTTTVGDIRGAGGRGGGYSFKFIRYGSIPASTSVVIGAGGAGGVINTTNSVGENGGNSSFGSLLTAYGGGQASVVPNIFDGGDTVTSASANVPTNGKSAIGGGGGASAATSTSTIATGGSSTLSGYGGNTNQPGQAPGGGGGAGVANTLGKDGARGEVRIWL